MSQSYLTNPYCNFKPKFKFDPTVKKNIVSCSFFKMIYPYKYFGKYINGLRNLIKFVESELKGFRIRIFIDLSIWDDKKIRHILTSNNIVEPVLYSCPSYMESDGIHHYGTFGTVVRFFPMFDFDNNDADHIVVADIELQEHDLRLIPSFYQTSIKYELNASLIYFGNFFYKNDGTKSYPYNFAGRMLCLKTIPKVALTDFMDNIYEIDTQYTQYSNKQTAPVIKYGIDEVFLNVFLIPYLINNDITVGCYAKYNMMYIFFYNAVRILRDPLSPKYVKYIMGDIYDDKLSLADNLLVLDENLYHASPNSPAMTIRFNELVKQMIKDHDYSWINEPILKMIEKYFMNIILFRGILDINKEKLYPDLLITVKDAGMINDETHASNYLAQYNKWRKTFLQAESEIAATE